ncbi:MAG: ATP-grasp domain-containing protein, partial [Saprospiraceae bacterium]|nr:ATP-grasp domain-containing protein [Saprospiraceae bacterium]
MAAEKTRPTHLPNPFYGFAENAHIHFGNAFHAVNKFDRHFFDFEAKYYGKSDEITPAVVEESIADKVRQVAKKVYSIFNCRGVVRIDFIYNEEEGRPYMLEVNTIPGQSEASIIPQQVIAMGGNL